MTKHFRKLIDYRIYMLAITGVAVYIAIAFFNISLWYILAFGVFLGIIFGKVFCRWVCPMGLIMELFMNLSVDGKVRQMYQYHKVGCPIAWISGWLNKFSLFRIQLEKDSCLSCGACDKQCYIVQMEPKEFSLYKTEKIKPGNSYTCSKCLKCVSVCPNDSLQYKISNLKN